MRSRTAALALFGVPGFVFFWLHQGPSRLPPKNLGWTIDGDWGQHVLGWLLFRNEPWSFPFGKLAHVAWPLGTSVGFTDSNLLMSLLLKPFSSWLPVDFQFIGFWFCLCFVLQGVFAGLLVKEMTPSRTAQFLGACLFVVAPILHARMGHDTLCAHFTLLGLFWLHFRPCASVRTAVRLLAWALGFTVLTVFIHPYLNGMVLGLSLALVARLLFVDRVFGVASALGALGVFVCAELLAVGSAGYLNGGIPAGAGGFGLISADLLTLINPAGRSRFFPGWRLERLKDEGFAYLGMGGLVLVAGAVVTFWKTREQRAVTGRGARLVPLAVASLLFAVFSLANHVTLAGKEILDLSVLYRPLGPLTGAFRASGRFTWALHYLLLALALDLLFRGFSRIAWAGASIAAVALALQLTDIDYQLSLKPLSQDFFHFQDPRWELARGDYAHLALIPPVLHDGTWQGCPSPWPEPLYEPINYEAYRLGITSNSFYVSRMDMARALEQCATQTASVRAGMLDEGTVYVVHPEVMGDLTRTQRARCAILDRVPVCVAATRTDAFARSLENGLGSGG